MAKQTRQIRGVNIQSSPGRGTSFEHQESIDDSLLPDAAELTKLKELDPNIIEWIKERTAKEQDARLDFNDRKMAILEKSSTRTFNIDVLTIFCAFFIIVLGMLFSYVLIEKGLTIVGSVFAGATILLAANAFLNFRKKNKDK